MKLKVPNLYSQRDPQWASNLLGYNTNSAYSIGQYGCLITAFGMYINQNPKQVNDILKANNGFVSGGGDFIWSKSTVLGLNQVYQSPLYSDAVTSQGISKMKSLLDEGRPLICHIDFNPATTKDDMHWILIYGYDGDTFYVSDPWTGTQITLDVYGGVARAVYEWRAYDKILDKDNGIPTVVVDAPTFEKLVRKSTIYDKVLAKLNVDDNETLVISELDKLIGYEDTVVQKDKQIQAQQTQISEIQVRMTELQQADAAKAAEAATLASKVAELEKQYVTSSINYNAALEKIKMLEQAILRPVFAGWKKSLVTTLDKILSSI